MSTFIIERINSTSIVLEDLLRTLSRRRFTYLELIETKIENKNWSSENLRELGGALRSHVDLEYLDLRHNRITLRGLTNLLDEIQELPNLKAIFVSRSSLDDYEQSVIERTLEKVQLRPEKLISGLEQKMNSDLNRSF